MRWRSARYVWGGIAAAVVIVGGVAGPACNAALGIDDIDANGCPAPGDRQCDPQQPQHFQTCGTNGQWQDDACEAGEHCEGGECVCTPGEARCMENARQTCDAVGSWQGGEDCGDRTCCDGSCVNTATDAANCAICGVTCNAAAGEICQPGDAPGPACTNVAWARWPMPNSAVDVAAGAPNLSSYIDNGNGTVTDMVTGLMWQQAVDPGSYTWDEAKKYCSDTLSNLALGGHHDWRLPSRIEIVSLVDYSIPYPGPLIDATYFPDTPPAFFWSTTPVAFEPYAAWGAYFDQGLAHGDVMTETNRVRCVR